MSAQLTLRGTTAHVQVGETGSYKTFNFTSTPELRTAFAANIAAGRSGNSYAGTATQYVPVTVTERSSRSVSMDVPSPTGVTVDID